MKIILTNVVWLLKRNKLKEGTIKTFQSNVDSPKYKMRMNFKQSGEIYSNELNKRQSYAWKTNRTLITKTTYKWTESKSKNKSEQNVYENAAATLCLLSMK